MQFLWTYLLHQLESRAALGGLGSRWQVPPWTGTYYLGRTEPMPEMRAQDDGKNLASGCSHQFLVTK